MERMQRITEQQVASEQQIAFILMLKWWLVYAQELKMN